MSIPLVKLTTVFGLVKGIQLLIVYFTPGQFDTSSQLVIDENFVARNEFLSSFQLFQPKLTILLDKFIIWDTVYFNEFFVNGIKYEHQFVFCPLWWRLIHFIPYGTNNYYEKLLLSVTISNFCHYLSCIILYYLTNQYFPQTFTINKSRFVYYTVILFIISPGGIFLTSGYSENFCNLLSFISIYLHEYSLDYMAFRESNKKSIKYISLYLLSGLFVSLNVAVRANSILLGGFYLIDLYEFAILNKNWRNSVISIVSGCQILVVLILLNIHSYLLFCPQRGEWCNNTIPLLFAYAQNHYWKVGFMKYWSFNNLPNFLFALPTILINILSIKHFFNELPRLKKVFTLIFIDILLLIGGVFFWNVQILTRISGFIPLSYWYTAILLNDPTMRKWGKIVVYYQFIWIFVQSGLFAAFLPPA